MEEEEYLGRVVIDPSTRSFYLYSDLGDERVVNCETVDQFMNALELIRATAPEEVLAYADPL